VQQLRSPRSDSQTLLLLSVRYDNGDNMKDFECNEGRRSMFVPPNASWVNETGYGNCEQDTLLAAACCLLLAAAHTMSSRLSCLTCGRAQGQRSPTASRTIQRPCLQTRPCVTSATLSRGVRSSSRWVITSRTCPGLHLLGFSISTATRRNIPSRSSKTILRRCENLPCVEQS
jgi:hypothetical protein